MRRVFLSIVSFMFFVFEFSVNVFFAIVVTFYNLTMVFIHCIIHYHERIEEQINTNFRSTYKEDS